MKQSAQCIVNDQAGKNWVVVVVVVMVMQCRAVQWVDIECAYRPFSRADSER